MKKPNKTPLRGQIKDCEVCGLSFHNRKKWASRNQWEEVKYCSDRCPSYAKKKKNR
ncbi:MAG: DUF2256 domain-containing protein [Bdellovibrionota bacterium]